MTWLYVAGIVIAALVFLALMAGGADEEPDDADRDYKWGDELHEYSYRHPWDDEI